MMRKEKKTEDEATALGDYDNFPALLALILRKVAIGLPTSTRRDGKATKSITLKST